LSGDGSDAGDYQQTLAAYSNNIVKSPKSMKDQLYRTYKLPDKPYHSDSDDNDYEELQLPKELQGNFTNPQSLASKPFLNALDIETDEVLGDPKDFS